MSSPGSWDSAVRISWFRTIEIEPEACTCSEPLPSQINTYTQQLEDNQFEFFGPLVDSEIGEKSLGIALREIAEDKLEVIPGDVARARRIEAEEARRAAEADMFSDISLDAPVSLQEGETPTSLDDIQF